MDSGETGPAGGNIAAMLNELVHGHRILSMEGHDELTLGHLSWRAPDGRGFWMKRHSIAMCEIMGHDDLVLVDLNKTATIHNAEQETKSKWSPWDGETLTGWPVRTWVMGREVFRDGTIDDDARGKEAQFDHARGGFWKTQA
ncbi:MAG: class II aldolase/adducin family protein [Proteobacteria bacterium]|nr:class II aldolase/adducin family protein [Pseudomonadota bacterium]